MGVSVAPHENGPEADQSISVTPAPATPRGNRRLGRRVLGIFGLVLAGYLQFGVAIGAAFLADTRQHMDIAGIAVTALLLGLPVLLIGFLGCLVGSPTGLRVAKICAVADLVLILAVAIAGAAIDSAGFGVAILALLPVLILAGGIMAMRPPEWPQLSSQQ